MQRHRTVVVHAALISALAASLAACGGDAKKSNDTDAKVGFDANSSKEPPMHEGDVKITSTDNVVVLSVIGDTVRMQLSDSLRNSVKSEVDSSISSKGDIGAAIAKGVSAVVGGAMGFVVAVDAKDVQNLRYEDGHLHFDVKGGNSKISTSGNSQDKAMFSAEDAQKFIGAVKARQGVNQ